MDSRFTNIKVLVWDFDGTLYHSNDALFTTIREAEFKVIMQHTGWDHAKTEEEFYKIYKVLTPSGTDTMSRLANIPIHQAALETEKHFDRCPHLAKDEKLITLFESLRSFRHVMLPNGIEENIRKCLDVLGLSQETFEKIITPETTLVSKPASKPFEDVLAYTQYAPEEHLMIGDRPDVDLKPAKELGMKTCLITWGQPVSEKDEQWCDMLVPTVYDLSSILI